MTLKGKNGLVVGIANSHSIAWGCAQAFHQAGASLAVTYLNEKALPFVQPLAEQLDAALILPLDVRDDAQLEAVFVAIDQKWGKLDFLLHAVAYAPKSDMEGRMADTSRQGFLEAMNISCYSFVRMAHLAEPLMQNGGCLLTTTYYGSEKVISHYNVMGPVKAALESTVRYLAADLGPRHIRVNALSPGPIVTRAASGIAHFDELVQLAREKSPAHEAVCIDCVGAYASFLVSDGARLVTGSIAYVDAGFNVMGS
ncbi:enoyl-ACP reductase FabI [Polaromonas naphthalenivorans]|uniref:Enoyl-[acyl-carrier-protein] reductase [NADH] n=1 Tax=Polaromonas naphthalenivorans (strain CJ2) TaxID=365044 RepID=A1VVX0_POLNA|nr:enoyl-ACP reductase FabI [Polaromonas naphthalenivorans]ABM39798.1 Enoyl-[acyl-carrier-protein] reductase (NADH) [Polaromonas naphthalenivorans CJ2]